jgi:hypothetical protein
VLGAVFLAFRDFRQERTGTPGLSGGLVTSLLAHGVGLSLVLGHTSVDGPARGSDQPLSMVWARSQSYWTMSGRMGALKTLGRGWLASPALPSAEMMETVGLLVILAVVDCSSLSSIQRRKIESLKSLQKSGGATSRLAQPKILALDGHSFAHSFTRSSAS